MRFASFSVDTCVGDQHRIGLVEESGSYLDITTSYAALLDSDGETLPYEVAKSILPPNMSSFLRKSKRAMAAVRRVVEESMDESRKTWNGRQLRYNPETVQLLSPLLRPNSLRDAMVYEDHVKNSFGNDIPDVWYDLPIYYKGNHNSIVHPDTDVVWPDYSEEIDYELELAAVIGKQGQNISAEEADEYIFGYTIFNDFSARDMQFREMAANLGPAKGKDFANGFGPYLTTTDAIDIKDVEMTARVNGEIWSQGSPGKMHHDFADIVEHVSNSETLYPGDIIGSGTVGEGCGLELGKLLSYGDTIELEVDDIGTLRHQIVERE